MPRLSAKQWSRKPRQPKTISSMRLKLLAPKPSEMSRPGGPPRLRHSIGNMVTSCQIWRGKSSKRRAEAKAKFLSTCPGHSVHQPTGAQECSGHFLPHLIGAGTSITSIHPIAEGFPSGRTAHSSHSSHTSAQAVSQAQKMAPFPRSCGGHAFGQNHFKGDSGRTPHLQAVRDPTLGQSTQAELH